ncbi:MULTISPECIES: hypothetical protein [unclassified Variovorax]|uniref:hypothetical protein n=1 Tax=unclassified Variovorax TaxID=663243 RepID=UPI00076D47CC|nr:MULTISPECIES: hypothetical protein [unclassified Variovorax]KWT95562.1 hypothetical protein APY03_2439 [Variovorax sp. WDL1]PNG50172.1 hypothetical protein CHC06_05795 [Variovorax sp. B2]PNG51045.1 hypothetical protein CHC07_05701 [Variovorax sp. B4]VTU42198.1 hypothetical protein SRS16P1_00212 [Variovorax sp. SRS16]VTU42230.1 hypothetical protein E5P1_00210 [Variovorax sp. PBL-E5]
MKYLRTPGGNLQFILESDDDKELVADLLETHGGDDVTLLSWLLEATGWSPNGHFDRINPEDVAALTDAPMLATDVEYLDDGSRRVHGDVWWYPDYAVRNFGDELLATGKTQFTLAA